MRIPAFHWMVRRFAGAATPSSRFTSNSATRASRIHLPSFATGCLSGEMVRSVQRGALVLAASLTAGIPLAAAAVPPADRTPGHFAEVTVAAAERTVYVAKVSLTIQPAKRRGGAYRADYAVKVFPFFFYNEHGELSIDVSDDQLRQLARGETVDFTGHATNSNGKDRRIEGHAVPDAAGTDHGSIKVRVWVSKNIEVTFNTVYRFTGQE